MKRVVLAFGAILAAILSLHADDWPMWGGRPDRNMVANEKNLPTTWSLTPKKNIKWVADLGDMTYGTPVVAGGRVFIGTNNGKPRDPEVKGDRGILMCFSEANGEFLWQAVHEKLYPKNDERADAEDYYHIGIPSTPCVDGDRVYYVSNRAELVCCDALGFSDNENDGPLKGETRIGPRDADLVWVLDMRKELGITPHQGSASSPLVVGDLVFVVTGQGRSYKTHKVENPKAPSFIAVDRKSGKVVWQDSSPGDRILTGQWSSPGYGIVNGRPQVAFAGGDGWIYAFEPKTGALLWKFNGKAHEKIKEDGKPETENQIFASPVYYDDRVIIAMGEHPDVGGGPPGCLRMIDAIKRGDITKDGEVWRIDGPNFEPSMGTVAVYKRMVFALETSGYLNCVDAHSGRLYWRYDLLSTTMSSPLVADGKVWVRTGDGEVLVFEAGRKLNLLATNKGFPDMAHGTVVAANGVLYLAGNTKLYAIAQDK